jgi:hypothetical protein
VLGGQCQQSRRARLAMDFSTGWACFSHASDVLGVCVMITSALLRTETERWREEVTISRPAWPYRWVPWQAWHDSQSRANHIKLDVTNTSLAGLGGAALAHTGLSFVSSGPASSSFLL